MKYQLLMRIDELIILCPYMYFMVRERRHILTYFISNIFKCCCFSKKLNTYLNRCMIGDVNKVSILKAIQRIDHFMPIYVHMNPDKTSLIDINYYQYFWM